MIVTTDGPQTDGYSIEHVAASADFLRHSDDPFLREVGEMVYKRLVKRLEEPHALM